MKKVLFTATVTKTHINTFHLPYIKFFKEKGYETHVCSKNDFIGEECIIPNCDIHYDVEFERSPINIKNIKAYRQLKKIINENKYEIIHCNTPVASILTRLAAMKARKKGTKLIYTAHGFHFFKGAPLLNWLLYYPVEKVCSYFTDVLITINKEDYNIAKNKMKAKKVKFIEGVGIDTQKAISTILDKETKLKELGIPKDSKVILSVGELSKRKNHKSIIESLAKIKDKNIYYVICGQGNLNEKLKKLSKDLNVEKQVIFAGFRKDILEICKCSDIFCFPSYQEGLPVSVMEAMSTGLPIICSNVRGNIDLVENGKGGYLYNPDDIIGFSRGIKSILEDSYLAKSMGLYNIDKAKKYDITNINEDMAQIYFEVLRGAN